MLCVHMGQPTLDKRGRLGVRLDAGSIGASCFNCSFKFKWTCNGRISDKFALFLSGIGVPEGDIAKLRFQAAKEASESVEGSPFTANDVQLVTWSSVELPADSLSLSEWSKYGCDDPNFLKALSYAHERRMDDFDNLYWTPCIDFQYNKRIIIPCLYNGRIVGYSARYYGDTPYKMVPKYLNNFPENFIYNLDAYKYNDRKYCIVCEGMLDAYLIDGVSCIGNSINAQQIEALKKLNKTIILCPDRDSPGQGLIDIAVREGWAVSFPKWEADVKDPAQAVQRYGKIYTLKTIIDGMEVNALKIHVSRKFDNYREKQYE